MFQRILVAAFLPALLAAAPADEPDVVFRSDVALARVDAQVLGRDQRAITGLAAEDFILLVDGKPLEIRDFGNENMPVDVLLLLDVSGSMRAHIERLASAAEDALAVLGNQDRVGVMVFDRGARVRMPFRTSRQEMIQGIRSVVDQETFDGGTDIERGLQEAARYVKREARREARRAIVILTDDQSERGVDGAMIDRALVDAGAVLSLLLAPNAIDSGTLGGSRRGGGSTWPGSGGGMGGSLGDIILGRRAPRGGGGNGPVILGGPRTQSARTGEIAKRSGGDSMSISNASAFEDTLERIRQRYALHYYVPDAAGDRQPAVEVQLAPAATRRYPNSEIHYRRMNLSGKESEGEAEPVVVSKSKPVPVDREAREAGKQGSEKRASVKPRRPAVDESIRPMPGDEGPDRTASPQGGWRRVGEPESPETATPQEAPSKEEEQPRSGGWRRLKPGEQP